MKKLAGVAGSLMLAAGLVVSGSSPATTAPQDTPPGRDTPGSAEGMDPGADRILREAGWYLASAKEFRFAADVLYDSVGSDGRKTLFGGRADVAVVRPDRLYVRFDGDEQRNRILLDRGNRGTFVFFDVVANLYARMEVPPDIDAALDQVFETVGQSLPFGDLVHADPYSTLIESAETGFVVGRHPVDGAPSHHLAFSNEAIDWQVWIEDGPRPVPRRLVITYKNEPGSPQYMATLSDWDFHPRLSEQYFAFSPPAGADKIDFLSIGPEEVTP